MTEISNLKIGQNSTASEVQNLAEQIKNSDQACKVENPALKKILQENSKVDASEIDIIQAYDRMYHTHNRS